MQNISVLSVSHSGVASNVFGVMVIVTVSAGAFVLTGRVGRAHQWEIAQQREHNQPLCFLKTAHPKPASLLRVKKTPSDAHSSKDVTTNHYGAAIIDQQSPGN